MTEGSAYEGPAIVELMGHRRLAGHVSEVEMCGTKMLRVDVTDADGNTATQLYSGGAIYCITPSTEEMVARIARTNDVKPVSRWELPEARVSSGAGADEYQDSFDDEPFDREYEE